MKKVLILALTAVAFLLGCSADGMFTNAGNPYDGQMPSFAANGSCRVSGMCQNGYTQVDCTSVGGVFYPGSNNCGDTQSPTGSCTVAGYCYDGISQSECLVYSGTFSAGACPSDQGPSTGKKYCYNSDGAGDCDGIGSNCSVETEAECNSKPYSTAILTLEECQYYGYRTYCNN